METRRAIKADGAHEADEDEQADCIDDRTAEQLHVDDLEVLVKNHPSHDDQPNEQRRAKPDQNTCPTPSYNYKSPRSDPFLQASVRPNFPAPF